MIGLSVFAMVFLLICLGLCIYFFIEYKKYKKSLRQDWANIEVTNDYKLYNNVNNPYSQKLA